MLSIAKERLAGYQAALADNGIMPDESLVRYCLHGGMLPEEVEEAVDGLLRLPDPPDAIFASADKLTTGCLRMLKARGIRVPEEMGLIGFSNTDLTELLDPPLSVIRQPAFEMGAVSTQLLLQLIESKRPVTQFETRSLATELFIRRSSQQPVESR